MHHRIIPSAGTAILVFTLFGSGCIGPEVEAPRVAPKQAPNPHAKEIDALVGQLKPDNVELVAVATRLAKMGDPEATRRGSEALVAIAERGWRVGFRTEREGAQPPVARTADDPLIAPEDVEKLARVFDAMDAIGGEPVIDFGLREASNDQLPLERRVVALMLLQHHVDKSDGLRAARVASLVTELDRLVAQAPHALGPNDDAVQVLAALTPDFRQCVSKTLAKVPDLDTKGMLTLEVGDDGGVTGSKTEGLEPAELAKCIEDVGKKAHFDMKGVGGAFVLRIPFKFRPH
jgi:hypothetical protein